MNKMLLIGHLGQDPFARTFPSGDKVVNIGLATTEKWKDKNTGDLKEATEWHNLVFRGRLAEVVANICNKGTRLYVEGKVRTRKWTDNQNIERKVTEVFVDEMEIQHVPERSPAPAQAPSNQQRPQQQQQNGHAQMPPQGRNEQQQSSNQYSEDDDFQGPIF